MHPEAWFTTEICLLFLPIHEAISFLLTHLTFRLLLIVEQLEQSKKRHVKPALLLANECLRTFCMQKVLHTIRALEPRFSRALHSDLISRR